MPEIERVIIQAHGRTYVIEGTEIWSVSIEQSAPIFWEQQVTGEPLSLPRSAPAPIHLILDLVHVGFSDFIEPEPRELPKSPLQIEAPPAENTPGDQCE